MIANGKVGVVTVTFNSSSVIDGFLTSLLAQTYRDFILYIVDNISRDNTLEQVAAYKDTRISIIANRSNVGIAEGNNQGIRAALSDGCEHVLLINNDTEFGPNLLEDLVAGRRTYKCDMIAPKILYFDKPETIWSAGGGFNRLRGYAGFHFGVGQRDQGQFDVVRRVDHSPACCLLISRTVFARIGLMDPQYFVYLDDTDFCFRAKKAGLSVIYLPSARLFHKASSLTGGTQSDFTVRYCTRNGVYFMMKHLGVFRAFGYLLAFQIFQLWKLLSRNISFSGFTLREKAFLEGLRLWMSSPRDTVKSVHLAPGSVAH